MNWRAYLVMAYGVLLIAGGIIGFVMANSVPSLIMGCGSALLILASGYNMLLNQPVGRKVALATTVFLLAFFVYRFFLTGKIMPAGMMAIASIIIIITLFYKAKELKPLKHK